MLTPWHHSIIVPILVQDVVAPKRGDHMAQPIMDETADVTPAHKTAALNIVVLVDPTHADLDDLTVTPVRWRASRVVKVDQNSVLHAAAIAIVLARNHKDAVPDEVALKPDLMDVLAEAAMAMPVHDAVVLTAIDVTLVLGPNLVYNVVSPTMIGRCMDHWPATRMSSTDENPGTNRLS